MLINKNNQSKPVKEQSKIYGRNKITPTREGGFLVVPTDATDIKSQAKIISIDGQQRAALSISNYGFTLEDFANVNVNKFGYKEVAEYKDDTLVVTASGYFVMYHKGVPSLVGLPSEFDFISGIWVGEDETVYAPRFTLYTEAELFEHLKLVETTSFRPIPSGVSNCIHLIQGTYGKELLSSDNDKLTSFNHKHMSSRFGHLYPTFTEYQYKWYAHLLEQEKAGLDSNIVALESIKLLTVV